MHTTSPKLQGLPRLKKKKYWETYITYKPVVQSKWAGSLSVLCSQWAVCKAFWLSTCGSRSVWWWMPGSSSAHAQAAPLPSSSCCTVGTLQNEPRTAFYRLAISPSGDNPLETTWIFKGPSCFEFFFKVRKRKRSPTRMTARVLKQDPNT